MTYDYVSELWTCFQETLKWLKEKITTVLKDPKEKPRKNPINFLYKETASSNITYIVLRWTYHDLRGDFKLSF